MTFPDAIFLDTNVFDRQHYNFAGLALASFAEACKRHKIPVLLPDPIERELIRHVRAVAAESVEAILKARRTAPFLYRARIEGVSPQEEVAEAIRRADLALNAFFQQVGASRVGYEGVDLREVMDWYDSQTPPFGGGGKRKEFPDALAMAIVGAHSKKNNLYIAVVSEDKGVQLACDRFTKLSHYRDLNAITEALVNDAEQVAAYKEAIDRDSGDLDAQIAAAAAELPFQHRLRTYELRNSKVLEARVTGVSVVAIGHNECTITFAAEVDGEHDIEWWEYDTPEGDIEMDEVLVEASLVTGLAKLQIDRQAKRVQTVVNVELDQLMLLVTENPTAYL